MCKAKDVEQALRLIENSHVGYSDDCMSKAAELVYNEVGPINPLRGELHLSNGERCGIVCPNSILLETKRGRIVIYHLIEEGR